MKPSIFTVVLAALLTVSPFASAQSGSMKDMEMKGIDMKGMEMKKGDTAKKSAEAKSHKGVGVVKSVDGEKGTVSIAHEPVTSMSWPAMTMTFKAKDKAMLEHVKPGAKVEFSFVQSGKDYIVTKIK
jgi:Cu(I)/Ag(I) efflux system protein CusF